MKYECVIRLVHAEILSSKSQKTHSKGDFWWSKAIIFILQHDEGVHECAGAALLQEI